MIFVNLPMMIFSKYQVATFRRKRSIPDPQVEPHTIHGGERAFLYQVSHMYIDICNLSDANNQKWIMYLT